MIQAAAIIIFSGMLVAFSLAVAYIPCSSFGYSWLEGCSNNSTDPDSVGLLFF
jgi:hypothetical protein